MKIQNFILLICNITLCYAALPINVGEFWFQITVSQKLYQVFKDNHVNLNKLKEDQSIIYYDSDQSQWVYSRLNQNGDIIFSIKLKNFNAKTHLNDEYMIEYLNYVKYDGSSMSLISKKFSPTDALTLSVNSFQKSPYYFQYQETSSNIAYIYWKDNKYQIRGIKKSLVIDYENDIVLTDASIFGKFSFDKDVIEFKYQIQLQSDVSEIAYTEIYTVNQVKLIGIYDQSLKFYDLNTFQEVSLSSNSDQIGQISYFNELFSYKNLIIVKTDVYKMSYDQTSNQVTLKKLKSLDKELTLINQTQANAIWRTSFTQGQTQILQVAGQNQIASMERILCQDGQFLTSKNINDNICFPCDQPTAQKSCECQNYNYQNSSTKDSCDQICDDGSFFNGSTCQKCTTNCIKCSSDQICDQCDETNGYFLDANKKNGCVCQKGYFLDNDSQCKKCKKGCDDCDKNKCNQCVAGYYKMYKII